MIVRPGDAQRGVSPKPPAAQGHRRVNNSFFQKTLRAKLPRPPDLQS